MVPAHRTDRVRKAPCPQNPEEDLEAKKRVRRDVEQPEVRRFLRQELLKKVGHSWWNRPRVYRHDLAKEPEPEPPVQAVVVIPSDPDQPETSPERHEVTKVGRGRRESSRSLLSLDARRRQHQNQSEAGPRLEQSRGRFKPCSVRALSSGKKNHRPYARTSPRPRSLGATKAVSQRTCEV